MIRSNFERHLSIHHAQVSHTVPSITPFLWNNSPQIWLVFHSEQLSCDNFNSTQTQIKKFASHLPPPNARVSLLSANLQTNSSHSSTDSELAPVCSILSNTDAANFKSLFQPQQTDDRDPSPVTFPRSFSPQCPSFVVSVHHLLRTTSVDQLRIPYWYTICFQSNVPLVISDLNQSQLAPLGGSIRDDEPKKKRNSYADSPHKLQCPFCPRIFPWISSLKRHILTHTGWYYSLCRNVMYSDNWF